MIETLIFLYVRIPHSCIFPYYLGIVDSAGDSLFSYRDGESWENFRDPSFTPVYQPVFSDPDLEAQATTLCGNDAFCLFDVAATGRMDIGLSTLSGSQNVELVIQLSLPSEYMTFNAGLP